MPTAIIILAVLASAVTTASAQPSRYTGAHRVGFATTTGISGTDGTARVQLPRPAFVREVPEEAWTTRYGNRNHELGVLEFYERGDEPCSVSVYTAWGYTAQEEHVWDGCAGNRRARQVMSNFMWVLDPPEASGRYTYLKAVRVCQVSRTDARRDIVKGVEAEWVTHPSAREWWATQAGRADFARPNCDGNWAEWARCPEGTAALALRLHHKALDGRRALTGLSLRCHIMEAQLRETETWQITDRYVGYEDPAIQPIAPRTPRRGSFPPLIPDGDG